jgi:Cu(I)/Ag(I) efflux system membrane fusion protein
MSPTPTPIRWAAYLAWFVVGTLAAVFVLLDPLDLHPLDDRLAATPPATPVGAPPAPPEREVLFYRNPMDPTITSPVATKDEMGMDYLPVYADEAEAIKGDGTLVRIDPGVVQNMNVRTELVERRDLGRRIRTVGYLEYDQERMVTVTTKYRGWVERTYANYVGEPVKAGQALFEIYSPELVQTEQELLSALQYAKRIGAANDDARLRAEALAEAARTRLRYWDISPEQIAQLERSGEIFRTLQVVAPANGLIMKRMAGLEGMAVEPGMQIFHRIQHGTPAEVSFNYLPGQNFRGTVRFIEPEFSEQTRTLRVKLEVPNHEGKLRSGMFATVVFDPVASRQAITVPSLAVLRTGERNVVVVDHGEGRFSPREIVLGHQGDGYVEVVEGLAEGERIVTSAQFLIDSEASLQEAVQKMVAQTTGPADARGDTPDSDDHEHAPSTSPSPDHNHGD